MLRSKTASEMKQISEAANGIDSIVAKIDHRIDIAAKNGNFGCTLTSIFEELTQMQKINVREYFTLLGYRFDDASDIRQPQAYDIFIYWN